MLMNVFKSHVTKMLTAPTCLVHTIVFAGVDIPEMDLVVLVSVQS